MTLIAQGSYGCVYKPPLKCKNKNIDYSNKVSKILYKDNATDEFVENSYINKIDILKDQQKKLFFLYLINCNHLLLLDFYLH